MKTIIKYIQLPFAFSAERLQNELNALTERWILHFNKAHYEGGWSALPLRSQNGSLENVIPGNSGNELFQDTPLMEQCPYIKEILTNFPCEQKAIRLLKLEPSAVIKEHMDADLCCEQGEARIHIPIITNPQLEFYLDDERVEMLAGSCWYMNFNLPHRINNFGTTDRVHLVMDIVVNDVIKDMFANVDAGKKKIIPEKEKFTSIEKMEIIDRLKAMGTDVATSMAAAMEAEMNMQ
jgi:quercetin dioxygenase-like cupin family protein